MPFNKADIWAGDAKIEPQRGNIELRQKDIARLIADKPTWIVISRRDPSSGDTIQLAPQVVRLEIERSFAARDEVRDKFQLSISLQHVTIAGYLNHPTIPNTDIIRGDQFFFNNLVWEVESLNASLFDRLLASASLKGY